MFWVLFHQNGTHKQQKRTSRSVVLLIALCDYISKPFRLAGYPQRSKVLICFLTGSYFPVEAGLLYLFQTVLFYKQGIVSERLFYNFEGRINLNILHVSLGLPPFRVGGLTRYCVDLMETQLEQGHQASLLYPGMFTIGRTKIDAAWSGKFQTYQVINPLPLALVFGINTPERYMRPCNPLCYRSFLTQNHFDVIHVHSFMGIHKEFFETAHELRVPMVFTTHDYYPLCMKCVLVNQAGELCINADGMICRDCNTGMGLSPLKEMVMQSPIYQKLKYRRLVTSLRKRSKSRFKAPDKLKIPSSSVTCYSALRAYYNDILRFMNIIHCNSDVAYLVYKSFMPVSNFRILPISHRRMLSSHTLHAKKRMDVLRIGYMGGDTFYKGLHILLEATQQLDQAGCKNWELFLYGSDYANCISDERIHNEGVYSYINIAAIYQNLDVIVVPSLWWETFGFVVLEALACGVPVIASNRVGSKSFLSSCKYDLIFEGGSPVSLAKILTCMFELEIYNGIAEWAYEIDLPTISEHTNDMLELYHMAITLPKKALGD